MSATINQLNGISSPSGSDLLPLYSQQNGDARKISLTNLAIWLSGQTNTMDSLQTQYAAPSATGFSVSIKDSSASIWLILTPTGTFAAGTLVLPSVSNVVDRQELLVNCTQAITALTISPNGATVTGAPTALTANQYFRLRFDAVTKTWYRVD